MKITTDSNNVFVIKHGYYFKPFLCMLFVAVGIIILLKALVTGNTGIAQYFGGTVNIVLGLIGVNFLSEKGEFLFDKKKRELVWSKHNLFKSIHQETVPFDEICSVITSSTSSSGRRHYRLEIRTENNVIPVSNAFSLGAKSQYDEVCFKIKTILNG